MNDPGRDAGSRGEMNPCGDLGSKTLEITDMDKAGAQKLYGLPLNAFRLIDA